MVVESNSYELVELGSMIEIVMGQAPPSLKCNKDGVGTPFVKAGEFGGIRPEIREWTVAPLKIAKKTDVLICVVGATCGKLNLGEDCAIGRSVAALRPDPLKLDQMYLYYFLSTLVLNLRDASVGAAQTVISKEMISRIKIRKLTIDQQKAIVNRIEMLFNSVDSAIQKTKNNLLATKMLYENAVDKVFNSFSSDLVRLGDVCSISYGYTAKSDADLIGPRYLRITDIQNNAVVWDNVPKCEISVEDKMKFSLKNGDIVFARTGATTGKSFLIQDPPEAVFASYLIKVSVSSENILPKFIYQYFRSGQYWKKISKGISGAAQGGFNASKLAELTIPKASLEQQRSVVDKLEATYLHTELASSAYESKILLLGRLKESILHKLFFDTPVYHAA